MENQVIGDPLGGPIFKKSSQNFPPDLYISLYTWKTTACKILSYFKEFWPRPLAPKVCQTCHFGPKWPFSSKYLNFFHLKKTNNPVFLIIFRRLAIILDFTALWTIKNEEMAIVWKLLSAMHVYSCFLHIVKTHWTTSPFFKNSPFLHFWSLREL